jgi:hypothetical protein
VSPSENISSIFYLSSTDGKLFARQIFDREQSDIYRLQVFAFDGHHRSPSIEILVHILDVNDGIPRFLFPNDQNDTLVIDRHYWNANDFICQIDIEDDDRIHNHSLILINRVDQLKNYDYLSQSIVKIELHSARFVLDGNHRLFFRSSNDSLLNEGIYYLAFKVSRYEYTTDTMFMFQ